MDFSSLMFAASSNAGNQNVSSGYSMKLPPVKKLPKAQVNQNVITSILKQKEKEKKKQAKQDKQRLSENLPKVKKKKGFTLDDLESNCCDESKKDGHIKSCSEVKDAKREKIKKSSSAAAEKSIRKDKTDLKNAEEMTDKSSAAAVENVTRKKKKKLGAAAAAKPVPDFISILNLAKNNVSTHAGSQMVNVEQLLAAKEIRNMFTRKRVYESGSDDDSGDCMEASYSDILKEEARSARLGMKEDLEDMRMEQAARQKKQVKKRRKMKKR